MFKEILIFIIGSTPHIITETISVLAKKEPPIYPSEVYIVTTTKGKEIAEKALIEGGILESLCKEYKIPTIPLTKDSFIIPEDSSGTPLEDIKNEIENQIIGDAITNLIKDKTSDSASRLHCSLAGGRKTMSFYLGAAMQLFARPWDKLYHVLVTPEFESNPNFFYKPVKDKNIECRLPDGSIRQLNTKNANIYLAELPYIRLSNKISLHEKGFKELVEEGQKEIDIATIQPNLYIKLHEASIYIGDTLVEMIPVHMMLYTSIVRRKLENCFYPQRVYCTDCKECFIPLVEMTTKPFLERAAKDYSVICGRKPFKEQELLDKWKEGIKPEIIRQNISKINNAIKDHLNDEILLPYFMITTQRRYGGSRYGVRVEKGRIKITDSKKV